MKRRVLKKQSKRCMRRNYIWFRRDEGAHDRWERLYVQLLVPVPKPEPDLTK